MPFRLIADAAAQTTIPGSLTSGATSFVGASTAAFTSPQSFGNGQGSLTILDAGNPAFNAAAPLATPYEYAYYTNNNTGTNTLSGLTRGVAGTSAHAFSAGAIVAQGLLAEDLIASVPWKFDEQSPTSGGSVTIPAAGSIPSSYLGVAWRRLRISFSLRSTSGNTAEALSLQLNGISTATYDYYSIAGDTSHVNAVVTNFAFNQSLPFIGTVPGGGANAGLFNNGYIECIDPFNSTKRKVLVGDTFRNELVYGWQKNVVDWQITNAPITSITLLLSAGSFAPGSLITTELGP